MTFIGIDLAWREGNPSGVAVARGTALRAVLTHVSREADTFEAVAAIVADNMTAHTIVAVDAPLIVRNADGQRACENAISRAFVRYEAAAYSMSLKLYPHGGPGRFAEHLKRLGFIHGVASDSIATDGLRMFEVYPHPAHVVLFNLPRTIKYKKGRVQEKRSGLRQLMTHMSGLEGRDPFLDPGARGRELLAVDVDQIRGRGLKAHEDALDAWFCVYLAIHLTRWGNAHNRVFGDCETGYIVVPS